MQEKSQVFDPVVVAETRNLLVSAKVRWHDGTDFFTKETTIGALMDFVYNSRKNQFGIETVEITFK